MLLAIFDEYEFVMRSVDSFRIYFCAAFIFLLTPSVVYAVANDGDNRDDQVGNKAVTVAPKVRIGGRFDNVRMCVASPAGTPGGVAADISLSTELALNKQLSLDMDLPLFRPIIFGAAFKMLQFEPSVTLKFRKYGKRMNDFVFGPMIGVSLHYGPDYHSENSGDNRGNSFFALGPILGGYLGVDFKRPRRWYNFQMGVTPYVTPLFGVADEATHKGVVIGGLVDFSFKFGKPNAKL